LNSRRQQLVNLAAVDIFRDMAAEPLAELEALVVTHALGPGDAVAAASADGDAHLSIVVDGRVGIYYPGNPCGKVLVAEIAPGASFGEFSVISGEIGQSIAEALAPTTIAQIPGHAFERFLRANPDAAFLLLRKLIREVRSLDRQLSKRASGDTHLTALYQDLVRFTL